MKKTVCVLALVLAFIHQPLRASTSVNADQLVKIRKEVETLRGNAFKRDVPAVSVSMAEIQALVNREIDKAFPGKTLDGYVEFETWMDLLQPKTDI